MPIEIDYKGKDINEIIEEVKNIAKNLLKENRLGGFMWRRGIYVGVRLKDENFYRIFYKCPKCGYLGFIDVKLKKNVSKDKPMLVIKCENCGYIIDEIKKVPLR